MLKNLIKNIIGIFSLNNKTEYEQNHDRQINDSNSENQKKVEKEKSDDTPDDIYPLW